MSKWTEYTQKEALKDNDELMILDTDGKANKRTLMNKVWDYVVDKMTSAVIAKLDTKDKTVLGAINELNSNLGFPTKEINGYGKDINSFTECGIYTTANAAPSNAGMKNYPIDSTGNIMVVKTNRQLTQFYITYNGLLYIRVKFGDGAYSKWRTVSYLE